MTLSAELGRKLYTDMWRIRLFEEEALRQTSLGSVKGTLHTYCGEEAVAVGVCAHLRDDDYVLGTHRSHGHCLAKGAPMERMMAELFGRATGSCRGKGGSMHIADFSRNILGANGIVAGGIGPGTGTALASKIRGTDQVSVVFFGDGAAARRGLFTKGFSLGLCGSCRWSMCARTIYTSNGCRAKMWRWWNRSPTWPALTQFPGSRWMVRIWRPSTTRRARRWSGARGGDGPTLIEARTYRYYGHSLGDKEEYRSSDEVNEWRGRDPIHLFASYMKERQWMG